MTAPLYLGIDFGTTSTKSALIAGPEPARYARTRAATRIMNRSSPGRS